MEISGAEPMMFTPLRPLGYRVHQGLASYTDNAENAMGLSDSVLLWVTPNSGMFNVENDDLMGFNGDLMGFNGDLMGFNGDLMVI